MLHRMMLPRPGEQTVAIRRYTVMIFILLTAQGAADLLFNLYLTRLGYREDFIGLVNAVTQLVWAGAAATAGTLANRWTARRVLIAGTLIFAVGYVARILFLAPWTILLGFSFACIGGGWVFAIGMVYIAEYTVPAKRLGAIALYTMASSLATTLGSIGGGWLPRLLALVGIGSGNAVIPLRLTLLISAAIMVVSVVPLVRVGPPVAEPAIPVTPTSLAAPEHFHPRQTRRDMWVYMTFVFILASGVAMIIPFYNVYLARHGFSTGAIGLIYGCGGIVGAIFGLAVPAFGARVGAARGAGILRSVPGLLFFVMIFVSPAWIAAAAHIFRRGCFDASYALESSFASRLFPPRIRAHVFAWREAVLSLGLALLSPVGGLLIVHFGYRAAFSVFVASTGIILLMFIFYFVPRDRALLAESSPARETPATLAVEST